MLTPFVHLRRDGENVAQQDGAPRWFVPYGVAERLQDRGFANDWRQMALPADAPVAGAWTLVVGLYDPATGQRAPVTDSAGHTADELVIGQVRVQPPPVPDQACALLPATVRRLHRKDAAGNMLVLPHTHLHRTPTVREAA